MPETRQSIVAAPRALAGGLRRWRALAAKVMHLALHILWLVTPLLGIASRMRNPGAWAFLGIPPPHAPRPDRAFGHMLEGAHETFDNTLMYLAALRRGGAVPLLRPARQCPWPHAARRARQE